MFNRISIRGRGGSILSVLFRDCDCRAHWTIGLSHIVSVLENVSLFRTFSRETSTQQYVSEKETNCLPSNFIILLNNMKCINWIWNALGLCVCVFESVCTVFTRCNHSILIRLHFNVKQTSKTSFIQQIVIWLNDNFINRKRERKTTLCENMFEKYAVKLPIYTHCLNSKWWNEFCVRVLAYKHKYIAHTQMLQSNDLFGSSISHMVMQLFVRLFLVTTSDSHINKALRLTYPANFS